MTAAPSSAEAEIFLATARAALAAAEAAGAALIESERRQLWPQATQPMLPVSEHSPRARLGEWKAANHQSATDTEVLVIALLLVGSDTDIADWAELVLDSQDLDEQALGEQ